MAKAFGLRSEFAPQGDQVQAIDRLTEGLAAGARHQVLKGVTGSGKTFTMANIIEKADRPVLVVSHNKTLAAQLYQEFRRFFPRNAVEYFVSYYDYYQPEAFIPASNTYIAKEATINDEIDRLRLCATNSLFSRRDVIIVASVSCIYGIGAPETYYAMSFPLTVGDALGRKALLDKLVSVQYEREEGDFKRGTFRVRGDIVEVFPSYEDSAYRIELEDGRIKAISAVDPLLGRVREALETVMVHPRTFFSTPAETVRAAVAGIEAELAEQVAHFRRRGMAVEAERIEERTLYDLEMLREFGYCPGIENYSRHLTGRAAGRAALHPARLLPRGLPDHHRRVPRHRPPDRRHVRRRPLPQDDPGRARLPPALGPRQPAPQLRRVRGARRPDPLRLGHARRLRDRKSPGRVVEQVIRPTGLIDPELEIRPIRGQVDDLMAEIRARAARNERVLVTTLTKKMAEDLARHYHELGLRVRYLHSEVETLDRVNVLRDLRKGEFDALIGINLLREGLDLPEVSLVAILDADKEGFLRSATALIQTFGRAARNVAGRAILYADTVTDSMKAAMDETARRRRIQREYNAAHGITPQSIVKGIDEVMTSVYERDYLDYTRISEDKDIYLSPHRRKKRMDELAKLMKEASAALEFEKAAAYRDELTKLKKRELEMGF